MKTTPWIIIVILLGLLILQRECSPVTDCPPCEPCILQHCDTTKNDTVFYPDTVYMPVPVLEYRDTGSTKFIYTPVDSGYIINDWLTRRNYIDTLAFDTNLFISVHDVIWKNRIVSRTPTIRFAPIIVTKTNTITLAAKPVHKLFVGMGVGRSVDEFGLAASLMYISKRDNAYSLSYDVLHKDIYFTMYWKLSFKR